MNDAVLDPVRHNSWATERLIEFCSELPSSQLETSSEGTYGSIASTLGHIVGAEGRYRLRLSGTAPEWGDRAEQGPGLGELGSMARDMSAFWVDFLSRPFDPDRRIVAKDREGTTFEVRAGVLVAQTINHGNEHRSQVYTVLTRLGVTPPDLDGWSWGEATGGFSELTP